MQMPMRVEEIQNRVKRVISKITNIPPHEIGDTASYRDELGLDSLSALEVIIDVEYEFQFKIPEAEVPAVQTVEDTVLLIQRHLAFATV